MKRQNKNGNKQVVDSPFPPPFLQPPPPHPPLSPTLPFSLSKITTNLAFPFKAAWWRQLNPRLFLMDKSTPRKFTRTSTISMKSLAMASWRTVSPYESCKTKKRHHQFSSFDSLFFQFHLGPGRREVLSTKMCRIITNLCVDITGEV